MMINLETALKKADGLIAYEIDGTILTLVGKHCGQIDINMACGPDRIRSIAWEHDISIPVWENMPDIPQPADEQEDETKDSQELPDIESMTKVELLALAESRGLDIPANTKKADIITQLSQ